MKTLLIIVLLCSSLPALTGCGQRGSLYFAEPETPAAPPPAAAQKAAGPDRTDNGDDDTPAR